MIDNELSSERTIQQGELEYSPVFEKRLDVLIRLAAYNTAGEPNTHGATPLDKLSTMHQQADLLQELAIPVQHPPYNIPEKLGDFVGETFRDRFLARADANDENYQTALLSSKHYEDNPLAKRLIERAEQGLASPAELILVRQMLGIRSVELACLTHPYGRRIDPGLSEMRSAVRSGVLLMGGEYYDDPEPKLRIKSVILQDVPVDKMAEVYSKTDQERLEIAHEYGGVAGILLTRKRVVGRMPDGTVIKERSSLILRADEDSYVMQSDLDALAKHPFSKDWYDEAVQNTPLEGIILKLLEDDEHTQAIPISTTIYAHNEETAKRVDERKKLVLAAQAKERKLLDDEHHDLDINHHLKRQETNFILSAAAQDALKGRHIQMLEQMVVIGRTEDLNEN